MSQILERVFARKSALLDSVASNEKLGGVLPVTVEDVKSALTAIPRESMLETWTGDIERGLARVEDPAVADALYYEWFYDGVYRTGNEALAAVFNQYELGDYSGTDLAKVGSDLGIERDGKPLANGVSAGGISIDGIMSPWYDVLSRRFDAYDRQPLVGTEILGPFNQAEEAFEDVFQLTMVEILHHAVDAVDADKPRLCILKRHDRWPMLVWGDPS